MNEHNENQSANQSDDQGDSGRDNKGRFTKGNKGGPGNPYARKSALLRKMFSDAISEQDMFNLAKSLLMRAIDGDMAAAKLVLSYGIGTPEPVRDPDRVDMDEMRLFQEGVDETKRMASALILPQPEVCCEMTRAIQETIKEEYKANLLKSLVEYEAQLAEDAQAAEVERILEGGALTEEEEAEETEPMTNGGVGAADSVRGDAQPQDTRGTRQGEPSRDQGRSEKKATTSPANGDGRPLRNGGLAAVDGESRNGLRPAVAEPMPLTNGSLPGKANHRRGLTRDTQTIGSTNS